ncbi:actin cortical patch SUR7/pH-response regulator pali, partial [Trichophaea hybrida]
LALISLLFLSGAIVLLFLLLLAGSRDVNSLNPIFFLQADTSGIPGAPDGICHWTLYNFCSSTPDGLNTACRPNTAAYPLDPVRNFGTTQGVPQDFVNHSRKYFYLSRFLFAFYIIDLFFSLSALLLGFWAVVGRYGGYLAAALVGTAWFCSAFNATVMTAVYTMGQNAWRREGRFARVGVKAMGFTW